MHTPVQRLEQRLVEINTVFRRLSATIRGVDDFERFVAGLRKTLEWVSHATGRELRFEASSAGGAPPDAFSKPQLHAPVGTRHGVGGLIVVEPPEGGRPFGPEDLHLVGTLAEFTGALLEISTTAREREHLVGTLSQLYDQLPLGVVCFKPDGEQMFSNARARVILGGAQWKTSDEARNFLVMQSGTGTQTDAVEKYSFVGSSGDVLAEIHPLGGQDQMLGTVVFLAEFEFSERDLRHGLEREIFRSRWIGQPLAFVALETAGDPAQLFAQIPDVRRVLRNTGMCDYFGQRRIGVVLPGRLRSQALRVARAVCRSLGDDAVRVGCTMLSERSERVDAIIESTLEGMRPAQDLARPRLLVVDRYRAVTEAIQLIVGDQFAVERASELGDAIARVENAPLDAVVVEHEPEQGVSALHLLETVNSLQPEALGVLTTTRHDLGLARGMLPENCRVIGKPFSVGALRAVLAPALESATTRFR